MCQYLYDNKLLDSSKGLLKLLDLSGGLLKLSYQRMKQYHLYKCVHKFLNQREREREREREQCFIGREDHFSSLSIDLIISRPKV